MEASEVPTINIQQIANQAIFEARREPGFDYATGDSIVDRGLELDSLRKRVLEMIEKRGKNAEKVATEQALKGYPSNVAEALTIAREEGPHRIVISPQHEVALLALGYEGRLRTARFVHRKNLELNIHNQGEEDQLLFLDRQAKMLTSASGGELAKLKRSLVIPRILQRVLNR